MRIAVGDNASYWNTTHCPFCGQPFLKVINGNLCNQTMIDYLEEHANTPHMPQRDSKPIVGCVMCGREAMGGSDG